MERNILPALFRDLWVPQGDSEFTISCGNNTFRVNRDVVCPQSRFFDRSLNGNFVEASSKHVNLPQDDPVTVVRVLSFLYTGNYDETENGIPIVNQTTYRETRAQDTLIRNEGKAARDEMEKGVRDEVPVPYNNLQVYLAADKFQIYPLKEIAKTKYIAWAKTNMARKSLPDVIRYTLNVLPNHDRDLREAIAGFIADNAVTLMENEQIIAILEDFSMLGFAVLRDLVKVKALDDTRIKDLEYTLANCGAVWDKLVDCSVSTPYCQRCILAFNVKLDGEILEDGVLVCKHCNTVN